MMMPVILQGDSRTKPAVGDTFTTVRVSFWLAGLSANREKVVPLGLNARWLPHTCCLLHTCCLPRPLMSLNLALFCLYG